jgi:hypothetical protein
MKESEFIGMEKLMMNLNKEVEKIKGKTMKGYIEVAILLRQSTIKDTPTVPVDQGNLRNSWFTTTGRGNTSTSFKGPKAGELAAQHSSVRAKYKAEVNKDPQPMMILGFSANYATFVHENMEAHFQGSGTGPKFLEISIMSNLQKIVSLIRENAEIK